MDSQRSPTTPVSSSSDAEVPVTPEPPGSSRAERKQGTEGLRSQGKCPHRSVLSATEVPGLFPNELLIVRRGAELWMISSQVETQVLQIFSQSHKVLQDILQPLRVLLTVPLDRRRHGWDRPCSPEPQVGAQAKMLQPAAGSTRTSSCCFRS